MQQAQSYISSASRGLTRQTLSHERQIGHDGISVYSDWTVIRDYSSATWLAWNEVSAQSASLMRGDH